MQDVSTVALLLRMTISLGIIGLILWGVQKIGKRRLGSLGRTHHAPLEVSNRKQLTKASSIALVRVGQRHLLIGITDSGVSLIAEGDDLITEPDIQDSDTDTPALQSPQPDEPTQERVNPFSRPDWLASRGSKQSDESEETDEISAEIEAIERHWDDPATTPDELQGNEVRRSSETSDVAGKPRSGAPSSTHSGTRALDALRDMTVRKT